MVSRKHAAGASGFAHATQLIREVCRIAGDRDMIEQIRRQLREAGIVDAIKHRDSGAIYEWLMEAINYQGVADAVATTYLEQHGSVTFHTINNSLGPSIVCPKLTSYWHFSGCGYRKLKQTCSVPERRRRCPLPKLDLRNGNLNQAAYSLWLFMRDVADGDLVGWFDRRLASADRPNARNRGQLLAASVLEPLCEVYGISDKVANMTLAALLLGGDPSRERWLVAGASMIAVDTLVHNWLHRTGILRRLHAEHPYGARCYSEEGCASIILGVSRLIDARAFNASYPKAFTRFVQKAIWNFCAQAELDQCNGNTIDDRGRCKLKDCPLYGDCHRRVLSPPARP